MFLFPLIITITKVNRSRLFLSHEASRHLHRQQPRLIYEFICLQIGCKVGSIFLNIVGLSNIKQDQIPPETGVNSPGSFTSVRGRLNLPQLSKDRTDRRRKKSSANYSRLFLTHVFLFMFLDSRNVRLFEPGLALGLDIASDSGQQSKVQALFGTGSTSSKALRTRLELGVGPREHQISLIYSCGGGGQNIAKKLLPASVFSPPPPPTSAFRLMSTRKITLICSLQSSSAFKIKDGDYKTLHSRLKQIVDGTQHLKGLTRLAKKTINNEPSCSKADQRLACQQALRGALAAGKEKEGDCCNYVSSLEFEFHLQFPGGSPSTKMSLLPPISAKRKRARMKTNIENDVITDVISANQHFALTFSMEIFDFQGRTCKLSFLFPSRRQSAPESPQNNNFFRPQISF